MVRGAIRFRGGSLFARRPAVSKNDDALRFYTQGVGSLLAVHAPRMRGKTFLRNDSQGQAGGALRRPSDV